MAITSRGEPRADARTRVGAQGRGEDRHLLRIDPEYPGRALLAVADGMGGHSGGATAAEAVLATLERHWPRLRSASPEGLEARLRDAHAEMARDLVELRSRGIAFERAGTTLTAACRVEGRAMLLHLGDSRAWLLRRGEGRLLTEDHSLAWRLHREGSLDEAERDASPLRHRLYRFLGRPEAEPDLIPVDFEPGDALLLVTDGSPFDAVSAGEAPRPYNPESLLRVAVPGERTLRDDATAVALVTD